MTACGDVTSLGQLIFSRRNGPIKFLTLILTNTTVVVIRNLKHHPIIGSLAYSSGHVCQRSKHSASLSKLPSLGGGGGLVMVVWTGLIVLPDAWLEIK